MKTITLLLLIIIGGHFFSGAQNPIFIIEEKKPMSKGEQPAYIVDIPHANYKKVEKAWKKKIEEGTKMKSEMIDNEMVILGAVKEEITSNPFNIYSMVFEIDTAVRLVNFFEIDSAFLYHPEHGTHEEEIYLAVKNSIYDFAVEQYSEIVNRDLEANIKILTSLEKEYDNLVKEKEKLFKSIRENEQDIESSNDVIDECDIDIENKKGEIEDQKKIVGLYKKGDPEKKKQADSDLSDIRKEKKKLEKKKEKELKNIVEYESAIIEAEREIVILEKEQVLKLEEIEAQKTVIDKIETHFGEIK